MMNTKTKLNFLGDCAAWLLGCGATCIRIEKNITRMASAFGLDVGITIMPRHVEIYAKSPDGEHSLLPNVIRQAPRCGLNFTINTRLSRLSWDVADRKISCEEAIEQFNQIITSPPTPKTEILFLASMANAAFCRLFGGDITAVIVVFIATLIGFKLRKIMLAKKQDIRVVFLCCSFFSAAICAGAHIFDWGSTPEIALGTSVLYLIPGVPYINSVSDLLASHYLCAFSRVVDALVLTACLSIGLCAGMYLLGLRLL